MNKSKKSLVVSIALATSMVASAFSAFAYTDVAGTDWFSEAVTNMSNKGLVNGYEDGTFLPNNYITRAEVAKILTTYFNVTVSTQEEMSDVPAEAWYADVMRKAVGAGYFKGDSGSDVVTYRPEANITRQEACVTVYRAFNWEPSGTSNFADNGDIADWAKNAIATLVDKGVIKGYEDNTFLPAQNITRAEFCKLFDAAMKVGTGTGTVATPAPGTIITGGTTSSSGHSSSGGGGTGTSPATAAPSKPTATPSSSPTVSPDVPTVSPDVPSASPEATATPEPITNDEKETIASMAPTEEEQKEIEQKVDNTVSTVANAKDSIEKAAEEKVQAAVDTAVAEQKDEKVQAAVEEKTVEEVDKLVAAKAEKTGKTVEDIKADAAIMEEINKTAAEVVEEQKAVIEEEVVKAITEETKKAVESTAKAEAEAAEAAKLASSFTYNDIYDALRSYNNTVISGETTANVNQIVNVDLVEDLGKAEKTKEAVNSPLYAYAMIKAQDVLDSEAAQTQKTALMATMVEMIEGTSEQLVSMVKDGKDLTSSESRTVLIDYVRNTLFPKVEAKLADKAIVAAVQTIARQTALDLLANTGAVEYIQGRGADAKATDLRYAYLKFVANMSDEDIAKDAYAAEFVK